MPDDETNLERRSLGEGGCPACPPGHTTVIPAVPNDAAPGTIPDEHLAVLRANASRPEVKARFIESMLADTSIPVSDFSAAEAVTLETPARPQNVRIHPPRDVGFGREEQAPFGAAARLRQPPLHPPEPRHMRSDVPTRREGGASYIRLHAYTDLPDVGPPQYIRHMTQPVAGIADALTRSALNRQPLFQEGPGTMQVKEDGCKVWYDLIVDNDVKPSPQNAELEAIRDFIETNQGKYLVGDIIELTLMPSGDKFYWQVTGMIVDNLPCTGRLTVTRWKKDRRLGPLYDYVESRGGVHRITRDAASPLEDPEADASPDELEGPPPELKGPPDVVETPRPPDPALPPGAFGQGTNWPHLGLPLANEPSAADQAKYRPPPATAPCKQKIYAFEAIRQNVMIAYVETRPVLFRDPDGDHSAYPTDAKLDNFFEADRKALKEAIAANPGAYTGGLMTGEGLKPELAKKAKCTDPNCPVVKDLNVEGWNLSVSDPEFVAVNADPSDKYRRRPVGDPDSPVGWRVSARFEIWATVVGQVWFSYWCV